MTEPMTKRQTLRQIDEQFRLERHREFLATALRLVTTNGLASLTMQGLATECGCGIGTLYRHFPSKEALTAELQRESIDVLSTAMRLSTGHVDDLLAARGIDDPAVVALARMIAASRFWIEAEVVYPLEIDLARRMFLEHQQEPMDADAASRVVPAAMGMLDRARQLVDDAELAGAIAPGSGIVRALVFVAGTTGVLMTSGLQRWDQDLFDGRSLACVLLRDLVLGWGASAAMVAQVDQLIEELVGAQTLVPLVRD